MKVLIGAAVATLLLAATAVAQTTTTTTTTTTAPAGPPAQSTCTGAVPPPPALPDGNTASAAQMQAGDNAYQAWATAAQVVLNCRKNEALEAHTRADSLAAQYNTMVAPFNATGNSWAASGAAFRAKHPARNTHNSGH